MKIERLRKSHKKKIIFGVGMVLIVVSTITLTMSKSKYRLTQSIPLVKGTINYKVPDMRVVAVNISEDGTNYEISNDIPTTGYILNEEKSVCKVATETSGIENAPKDENIIIEYIEGKLNIKGVSKRNTRCYLYFDKKIEPSEDTLANLGITDVKDQTDTVPDFSKTAETDEGIFRTDDGMYGGKSTYWRGAATTNHLIFANKCWRIVRINGDGTIRLIYNGTVKSNNTCTGNGANSESIAIKSQPYNKNYNKSEYVGYTYTSGKQRPINNVDGIDSNLKTQTDNWFNTNITGTNLDKVADGKFCNDRNVASESMWESQPNSRFFFAAYERLTFQYSPTMSCDKKDIYVLKAGAITADEMIYSGGVYGTANHSYYIYNGEYYWTMTPYLSADQNFHAVMYFVWDNGYENWNSLNSNIGIRPVINLRSDVTFNSGSDGTQNNPYIVQ